MYRDQSAIEKMEKQIKQLKEKHKVYINNLKIVAGCNPA